MARVHNLLHFLVVILFTSYTVQATWVHTTQYTEPSNQPQNLTKLHFYFHDIVSGPKPTAVIIAKPENATSVGFGTLVMIDDPLTVGPDKKSKIIGRAQGVYGDASQGDGSLLMAMTFSFVEGSYKGSSVSILGKYHLQDKQREMPVIGGSGVFKLARGYALATTTMLNATTGDGTAQYNVFVLHSHVSFESFM